MSKQSVLVFRWIVPVLFFIVSSGFLAAKELPTTPFKYEKDVRDYAYRSIDDPPVPGCTLFIGSSSFRIWGRKAEEVFSDDDVVNRGFGGSRFPDNIAVLDRIHLPYHPERVVIFCGTNDIAGGATAETVFENFKYYIARHWNENPLVEIFFVSLTHAPVREKFWPEGDKLNDMVKDLASKTPGLFYIDIITPMQGENGRVREELFVKDRLHLNEEGYKIWEKTFREAFEKQDKQQTKPDTRELYKNRNELGLFKSFAEYHVSPVEPPFWMLPNDANAVRNIIEKNLRQNLELVWSFFAPVGRYFMTLNTPHQLRTCSRINSTVLLKRPIATDLNLNIVFLGDSITQGVGSSKTPAPVRCVEYLKNQAGIGEAKCFNVGVSGFTTVDFLPSKNKQFVKVKEAADKLRDDAGSQLVFSIMLGTNDSAIRGPNGAPVSQEDYRKNLKEIVDRLLADYPGSKVVIHRPIWYSSSTQNSSDYLLEGLLRVTSYGSEIEALADYYRNTSDKERVFLGDTKAYSYFKKNYEKAHVAETGKQGTFYLHPNEKGADVLGRFWGEAIRKAIQ